MTTTQGKIVSISPSVELITGLRPEDLIGQDISQLAYSDMWHKADEAIAGRLNGRKYLRFDMIHKNKSGTPIGVSVRYSTFRDHTNAPLIIRFVSLLKNQVSASPDKRQHSGKFLCEIDKEDNVLYANSGVLDLFGFLPEEIIGRNLSAVTPPRFKKDNSQIIQPLEFTYKTTCQRIHKNGTIVSYCVWRSPLIDDTGNYIGYRSIGWDA